jgi:enoyl-CoA hydratase/carnithine racemase
MSAFSDVLDCDLHDNGVAVLTLNRVDARNALSAQLRDDLCNCCAMLSDNNSIDSVVLTGAGEMFCAGFDLRELAAGNAEQIFADAQAYHRIIYTFKKPLVAAINGPALAGGMDLAAMCDIRVATPYAVFGQPQVRMGIPAAYDLMKTVLPDPIARRLCLTGEKLDAQAAVASGFVASVMPQASLLPDALELAAQIGSSGKSAAGAMKQRFVRSQADLFGGDG